MLVTIAAAATVTAIRIAIIGIRHLIAVLVTDITESSHTASTSYFSSTVC